MMTSASWLGTALSQTVRKEAMTKALITPREKEVLTLIAYEYSTKQIAAKLYVSYETVSSHRQNLMRKLEVKNAAGLVRVAFERNLLMLNH